VRSLACLAGLGGPTSSECLAMGQAMILKSPIPGPEERNAQYLLQQGVRTRRAIR